MATKDAAVKKDIEPAPPAGLPLFFKKPAVLSTDRHANAAVVTSTNYAFARDTNSVGLTLVELAEAAKYYPIVFTDPANPFPAAVLGLETKNYFVDAKGAWKEDHYIPAYARQYPFIFFQQPDSEMFYLSIDEGAPHFRAKPEKDAVALYTQDGAPSELAQNALKFCSDYYQQHVITRNFCDDLVKHKLLVSYQTQAQLKSGKLLSLAQFMIIDEAAFNALSDEVYLEFRKKGWLAFIYFALASTSNWNRLIAYAE